MLCHMVGFVRGEGTGHLLPPAVHSTIKMILGEREFGMSIASRGDPSRMDRTQMLRRHHPAQSINRKLMDDICKHRNA